MAPALGAQTTPARAADCEFKLGFKALHDLIPEIVGDCLDNETHNPENGDGLQMTARGLMVWRKADNWTAFTDGSTTWINGPFGLESRPNNERFSWEPAAPPPAPAAAPAPAPPPPPEPAAAPPPPAPAPTGGPISKQPTEIILSLNDVGKDITQMYLREGADSRSKIAEIRFERDIETVNSKLGPTKVLNRVYVANDVAAAQSLYREEAGKQTKMPEADERVGAVYQNEGKDAIAKLGDEQISHAACNDDCNSKDFNRLHQRTVLRFQNVVAVLYFWGANDQATTFQTSDWLGMVRGRMG
jgi:hypothetical protein